MFLDAAVLDKALLPNTTKLERVTYKYERVTGPQDITQAVVLTTYLCTCVLILSVLDSYRST